MNRFGLLVSGNLGFECLLHIEKICKIEFIFTDSNSKGIIEYATNKKIPIFVGNPRNGNARFFLKLKKIEYLLSINYLFIIEDDLIKFPSKFSINIHGSLLPKYRGRTPHIWAIINNETITGITAHILTEHCDQGDIILQEQILIENNITSNDLLEKYKKSYPKFISNLLKLLNLETIKLTKQEEYKATWFNKRTPKDGLIIWSWQKERLYNWIRALSFPYPGAFTFYENEIIIIDEIEYSDIGFNQDIVNGTILIGGENPIIKTSNGAIKVTKHRSTPKLFIKDKLFYERY